MYTYRYDSCFKWVYDLQSKEFKLIIDAVCYFFEFEHLPEIYYRVLQFKKIEIEIVSIPVTFRYHKYQRLCNRV